jgi:hypothetical protein
MVVSPSTGHGRGNVCTCRKTDPEWIAKDEQLLQSWREAQARVRAVEAEEADRGITYGDRPPYSPEYTAAMDALYGPEGLAAAINWHRYGYGPSEMAAAGKWRR